MFGTYARSRFLLPIAAMAGTAAILVLGFYLYVKSNPPLVAYVSGSAFDRHVVLVEAGNKSKLAGILLEKVLVNGHEVPANVRVQVSNPEKGFIISDRPDDLKEGDYTFYGTP